MLICISMMKQCSKCLESKSESEFYPRALKCKRCCIDRQRRWALEHPESVKRSLEKFKTEKTEQYKASQRKYFENNREMLNEKSNNWKKQNREKWNGYIKTFKQNNPNYMLSEKLRSRIRNALRGNPRSSDIQSLLGCSYSEFREYIQSKFEEGMAWHNFGEWHIDHIRPCCSFNLSDPLEQAKCFHYTNMQPLWAKDNLQKHKKIV